MKRRNFIERSLVLAKPESLKRGIIGKIISRFEDPGLKIIGMKMVMATRKQLEIHLPTQDLEWIRKMGEKNIEANKATESYLLEDFGTTDPMGIGKIILERNFEYLLSGPVVAIVLEGVWAIGTVRKIVGNTNPADALSGTIRGDFSSNAIDCDNHFQRSCYNIVHASGNSKEADREIPCWFHEEELVSYERYGELTSIELPMERGDRFIEIGNIEEVFEQKKENYPREAVELAFAIAMISNIAGKKEKAIQYGREGIELSNQLNAQTEEGCATRYLFINGISIPELIHEEVFRRRLYPLQL